jgi:prepilin-type N-terminal cleavage/methylation domain-containing protein
MQYKMTAQRGFTLVETLITLGIAVLLGVVLNALFANVFKLHRTVSEDLLANGNARRAIKTMTSELRTASPSNLGAYNLEKTGTSSLIFFSNIDTDSYVERVRYYVEGSNLKKGVIKPTGNPLSYVSGNETVTTLVERVVNSSSTPLFQYYNRAYTGTSSPLSSTSSVSEVRLVKTELRIAQHGTNTSTPEIYTTQVNLRNLKDNL